MQTGVLPLTCPCPRDIVWTCPFDWLNPLSSANFSRAAIGSAPGDSTKISGAQQFESENDSARSKVGGSMYVCPRLFTMKSWTAGTILSGRKHRRMTILSMPCNTSNGLGYFLFWGADASYICFHCLMFDITSVMAQKCLSSLDCFTLTGTINKIPTIVPPPFSVII